MTRNEVEELKMLLEQEGVKNVSVYVEKLQANHTNLSVFEDLLFESRAAWMFLKYGFQVEMRESPDLSLQWESHHFHAEVKHFRMKETDTLDQARMNATRDELVVYGDTIPLEGLAAWDQVVEVAKRKIKQYQENVPNILVIGSSSFHCIDDAIMPTAINIINEKISTGNCVELSRLNGILLISPDYNIGQKRGVYFFQTHSPTVLLDQAVIDALHFIRQG